MTKSAILDRLRQRLSHVEARIINYHETDGFMFSADMIMELQDQRLWLLELIIEIENKEVE
jgi:hypothetical protein